MQVTKKQRVTEKINFWADKVEQIANCICVIFLTLQVIAIIVMVVGRYCFNFVPRGTEEFSLFCMVWFSLLSIMLSIRNEKHIKVELMDVLVAKSKLKYFKIFAGAVTIAFSVYMVKYGISLTKLTFRKSMSSLPLKEGWLYLSIPVTGVCIIAVTMALIITTILTWKEEETNE